MGKKGLLWAVAALGMAANALAATDQRQRNVKLSLPLIPGAQSALSELQPAVTLALPAGMLPALALVAPWVSQALTAAPIGLDRPDQAGAGAWGLRSLDGAARSLSGSERDSARLRAQFDADFFRKPSESCAVQAASALGLADTYERLQQRARQRHGLNDSVRAEIVGWQWVVTERTTIGLPQKGRATWLPFGGFEGDVMRSVGISLAGGAMAKIKGTGAVAQEQRVPIQVAVDPLGKETPWTWKYRSGSSLEDARNEFSNLLLAHALFERAVGKPAPFPIPVDFHPLDSVEINGREVSILRAWSDDRLWPNQDDFRRHFSAVSQLAEAFDPASAGARLERPSAAKSWLDRHGIPTDGLSDDGIMSLQARARTVQRLLEKDPLGQVVVIEKAPVRNQFSGYRDAYFRAQPPDIHVARRQSLDERDLRQALQRRLPSFVPIRQALLRAYGRSFRAPSADDYKKRYPGRYIFDSLSHSSYMKVAVSLNGPALARTFWRACEELGEAYGLFAAIGANSGDGWLAKDLTGGQITDFMDMTFPNPQTRTFNTISAKGNFWLTAVSEPMELFALLFGADPGSSAIHARGEAIFQESARRTFKAGVERLIVSDAADGLLSPEYRRSLLGWLRKQLSKPVEGKPISSKEEHYRKMFGPVLREIRWSAPVGPAVAKGR